MVVDAPDEQTNSVRLILSLKPGNDARIGRLDRDLEAAGADGSDHDFVCSQIELVSNSLGKLVSHHLRPSQVEASSGEGRAYERRPFLGIDISVNLYEAGVELGADELVIKSGMPIICILKCPCQVYYWIFLKTRPSTGF